LNSLISVTTRVLEDRRQRRAKSSEVDVDEADGIVGHDPRMSAVFKLIGQAASTRATVLIRGESGTGKELVARAIHEHSQAAREPFVAVNCAALPSTLLESELFGHVRGAFTGAHTARRGRFTLAGRGTIFLDEIGDTSLDFQTKLLRVIQDREFEPVGAEVSERTDARVIAATHQDLESLIAQSRFRQDLYYRLRVVEITIPPLRERPGDIPILARHMIKRAAKALGTSEPVLTEEAISRLREHPWPGNVRELENCIMRAIVIASGNVVRAEHLSFGAPKATADQRLLSLEDVERTQIQRVLAATDGHKGSAADILGVTRPRLKRLMNKYGLE
jgi:DNA-binding NtrC family response regulator